MKARVYVRLKTEVSDPQGSAIREALCTLHYDAVKEVRVGKVFDLELDETDRARAGTQIESIAGTILSNPVIEDFQYEILDDANRKEGGGTP